MMHPLRIFIAALLFAPVAAEAATCTITTYYSDASMVRAVGSWSNCPGQKGLQGKRTKFKESETIKLSDPPPGPGSLPCEFLARGCNIFHRAPVEAAPTPK